ncbi:MAG: glycerophosphodiester phosphodiesterase family protein [Actinomycetaceae bacterium]|nr:glycerophosphodiester phosphodiesterase family protein [Actinomycetaceae bacterium]
MTRLYSIGQPVILAHRGGGREQPENSIDAFIAVRDAGFGHVETDVHATSDGIAVFFHDDRLDRTTDGKGRVSSYTWRELQRVRDTSGNRIVRVDEALDACPGLVFNIDAKSNGAVEPLVRAVRSTSAGQRVCIASFSERRLRCLRSLMPAVASSLGTGAVARIVAASRLPARPRQRVMASVPGPERGVQAVQVPLRSAGLPVLTPGFVEAAHARGLAVHAWTIDDVELAERLMGMGVDGIVTDVPTAMREHLAARGYPITGAAQR